VPRQKKIIEEKIRATSSTKTSRTPQLLRGMKDILPSEQKYWHLLRNKADSLAKDYGFLRIDTPIMEETGLFVRAVGKQTDIVEKEMFSFVDQGSDNISLRPEATASIVRAYINHGMINLPQPVKLFYWGPMFRHERPQSGRQRQFYQFGCEALGDKHPVVDAELILMAYNFFKEIGLETSVQINSLGCADCRPRYKDALTNYYRNHRSGLCENCKKRLLKNPLRLFDCKEFDCQALKAEAPQIVDWLCEDCKTHFVKVLEYLDELQISYVLNPSLVRGLDYYTKTVFEIWPIFAPATAGRPSSAPTDLGEEIDSLAQEKSAEDNFSGQSALGGGGRYDNLVELLGGRPTPACGFSLGIERTILKLKEANTAVPEVYVPDIFIAQLGESAKRKSLILYEELRNEGIKVAEIFSKDGLKPQLEAANKLGVKYALILGQKELVDGTIIIRDMEAGIQEIVDFKKVVKEVKKRLGLNGVEIIG
jgi:histidyl-tRNA synthetase